MFITVTAYNQHFDAFYSMALPVRDIECVWENVSDMEYGCMICMKGERKHRVRESFSEIMNQIPKCV